MVVRKFLFQIGAIRRLANCHVAPLLCISFYSKLVRLEVSASLVFMLLYGEFLFQIGAIRRRWVCRIVLLQTWFLFQIGAIRSFSGFCVCGSA